MKLYVQHKSGQGEKWRVLDQLDTCWKHLTADLHEYYLPKSEYIPCPPPSEEWEDVTAEYKATKNWPSEQCSKSNGIAHIHGIVTLWIPYEQHHDGSLRLRKIDGLHHGPAFIVEKRKS